MYRATAYIITTCLLVACGLKGPLYLPEESAGKQTVPEEEEREAQENKPQSPLITD
jgi:predicted small lipoprotein YifL